jgi:predicted RND superfamily exporter protein
MARLAEELEQLLLQQPALQAWIDMGSLGGTQLHLLPRAGMEIDPGTLAALVDRLFRETQKRHPALSEMRVRLVGQGLLARKIAGHLVPTLVESFALTAAVIFLAFLVVFRSGTARILAMIPSLVAILSMFLLMRLLGIPLNVATILIATTVLGASENDQIHFFWHFQEGRRDSGTTEQALAHAIRVSGGAIFFATLVNAGGFLALALSDLPPVRQFGVLTASAFVVSMLADFTALPAALWIFLGERPSERG